MWRFLQRYSEYLYRIKHIEWILLLSRNNSLHTVRIVFFLMNFFLLPVSHLKYTFNPYIHVKRRKACSSLSPFCFPRRFTLFIVIQQFKCLSELQTSPNFHLHKEVYIFENTHDLPYFKYMLTAKQSSFNITF